MLLIHEVKLSLKPTMKNVMHATYGETLAFMIMKRSQIATSLYQIAQSFMKFLILSLLWFIVVNYFLLLTIIVKTCINMFDIEY